MTNDKLKQVIMSKINQINDRYILIDTYTFIKYYSKAKVSNTRKDK